VQAQPAEGAQQAISDVGRYCTACWRNARLPVDSWNDCTQEVFARLLQSVPTTAWGEALRGEGDERRELLRAVDAVKKRTQRARKFQAGVEALPDARGASDRRLAEDREALKLAAEELLSPRQQRILRLSLEGWAAHEIAEELDTPVERVSDEKYKAVRKLRARLGTSSAPAGSKLPA
jgi:RNA polymerase sigma factor (sigma-70 family)